MTDAPSQVLVVAELDEAARIAGWLEEGGIAAIVGDGSDDTLATFETAPSNVVVLAATLPLGDALVFAGVVRDARADTAIVLIGDSRGPVRTALDALDFGADRFLRRPLDKAALVFAVRSCLPAAPTGGLATAVNATRRTSAEIASVGEGILSTSVAAPPTTSPGGVGSALASVSMRLDEVTTAAIDAFMEEVVEDAVVGTSMLPAASTSPDEPFAEEPPAEPPAQVDDDEPEIELIDESMVMEELPTSDSFPNPTAEAEPLPPRATTQVLLAGPDETTGPGDDGETPSPHAPPPAVAQPLGGLDRTQLDSPLPDGPTWREPTQILSGPPPFPAEPRPFPTPAAPEEQRTGTFVSELRSKMSAIEERLFGPDAHAPGGATDDSVGDIDLDSIGVTVPGVAGADLRQSDDDGEPRLTTPGSRSRRPEGDGDGHRRTTTAPGARGDLRDEDTAFIIARMHREAFTGRLTFRRADAQKSVFFDAGRPVFATSNLPHDRMGDLLFREGKITRDQHARSREIVAGTGRRMGEILVDMGFLKRRELLPAVRRHLEDVLFSLFAWDAGTTSTTPGDSAADEKIRLATHPVAIVFEGIRRKMGPDRLRDRVGPSSVVLVPLKRDEIAGALAEADLAGDERRVADLIDGRRTLADVVAAAHLDESAVYPLAYGLLALNLAHVLERGRDASEPGRASTAVGVADVMIDRERVRAKHAQVREGDYFAILGVRRDATGFEIRRAYEGARRDYAADAFAPELQRELDDELRDVATVIEEAYRVLRDDRVRTLYLSNLED